MTVDDAIGLGHLLANLGHQGMVPRIAKHALDIKFLGQSDTVNDGGGFIANKK